jgi:sugar phosphate isomerase/epimerase
MNTTSSPHCRFPRTSPLSRRAFVGRTAALAGLAATELSVAPTPAGAAADPPAPGIGRPRLGCVSWNFHPLRAGADPAAAIDSAGELGFEGIELIICAREDVKAYWTDAAVDRLRAQLERRKLVVSQFALFQPVVEGLSSLDARERAESLDYFETGCRLARRLGSPLVNIVAPWAREFGQGQGYIPRYYEVANPQPGQKYRLNLAHGFDYAAVWQGWVATVKALVERAKAHGLKFALEHHTHCLVEDANAFLRLCDAVPDPALGYNLDVGWTLLQREYPPLAVHKVGRRLFNMHLRDIDARMRSFVPAGEGVMDFPGIADAVRRIGFTGFMSLEQDRHEGMEMKATCARFLDLMRQCLG